MTQSPEEYSFSSQLPLIVLTRLPGERGADWQMHDQGVGLIRVPAALEVSVRVHNIDDRQLLVLVGELSGLKNLTHLDLSENRNITDDGLKALKGLPGLSSLNLSSCSITASGLGHLSPLSKLESLNLSFCNRLTDPGLKALRSLPRLSYLDVQGCVKLTHAGLARIGRKGLTVHR